MLVDLNQVLERSLCDVCNKGSRPKAVPPGYFSPCIECEQSDCDNRMTAEEVRKRDQESARKK